MCQTYSSMRWSSSLCKFLRSRDCKTSPNDHHYVSMRCFGFYDVLGVTKHLHLHLISPKDIAPEPLWYVQMHFPLNHLPMKTPHVQPFSWCAVMNSAYRSVQVTWCSSCFSLYLSVITLSKESSVQSSIFGESQTQCITTTTSYLLLSMMADVVDQQLITATGHWFQVHQQIRKMMTKSNSRPQPPLWFCGKI